MEATFLERNIDAVTGELETAPVPKKWCSGRIGFISFWPFPWAGCARPERLGLAALLQVRLNGGLDDGRLADAVFLRR